MGKLIELIFIPTPGAGHIYSTIEMAKILLEKDERLSATILLMKMFMDDTKSDANPMNIPRLQLVDLPQDEAVQELMRNKPASGMFMMQLIEVHKSHVRNIVSERLSNNQQNQQQIGGFVIDMFCTTMIDVANEFALPTYVFFASNASMFSLMLFFQEQVDEHNQDPSYMFKDSDVLISVPGFKNPVPTSSLPSVVREAAGHDLMVRLGRKYRNDVKGIIINTFTEIEPDAIQALSQGKNPPVYPVGPVLNLHKKNPKNKEESYEKIMSFLDSQPPSSVVFLCFGSMGSFDEKQVREIATALEKSEQRFLWALRMRPKTEETKIPTDLTNPEEVLPEGFLERTKDIGRVIGWSPQMEVLSHPSVGGFVSHCGWNSTLESVWSGVLIGTWPLYAEQQLNAFQLVKELGMAVNIKMDYRTDFQGNILSYVSADEIESGIRKMMEMEGEEIEVTRKKVMEIKERSRAAVVEGGSSYTAIGILVNDIIDNTPSILN